MFTNEAQTGGTNTEGLGPSCEVPTHYFPQVTEGPSPFPGTLRSGAVCVLWFQNVFYAMSLLSSFLPTPASLFLSVGFNERHRHPYPCGGGEESGQKMSGESCLDQLHQAHRICQNRRSVPRAIAEVALRAHSAY